MAEPRPPTAKEEMIRIVLARALEAIEDVEKLGISHAQKTEAGFADLARRMEALTAELTRQNAVVARLDARLSAESAEVARIQAERIAGKAGLIALLADRRVTYILGAIIGGAITALLAYFGVPHASP